MAEDLEIIHEIEKILGIQLKQVAYADILEKEYDESYHYRLQTYSIDDEGRVIGLCLDTLRIDGILELILELESLQTLSISEVYCSDLTFIKKMPSLRVLDISSNELSDLSGIKTQTNLTSLDLSGNNISDLSGIKTLTNLTTLSLWNNNISDISHLKNLSNLKRLNLENNKLTEIPGFLLTHPNLKFLGLRGNPIQDIEPVLLETDNCLQKVRDYYKALERFGYTINNEVKLLLLGNGRVGKTSIVNRLTGAPFDPQEISTHGIQLLKWLLPVDQQQPLEINIYDFGGQGYLSRDPPAVHGQ